MVKKGVYIEIFSILWMIIEAIVAINVGLIAHSLALVAFGADSVIELIAGLILLWRLLIEIKGESIDKVDNAEKVASWVVGIALLLLAVYIVISSFYNLYHYNSAETSTMGIYLAIVSSIIMPVLARIKIKIGSTIGSNSLKSDGYCSMVCAYMSWILVVGVILTALLGWWWIDTVISLAFVYFVIHEGIEAIQDARGIEDNCCGDD